MMNRTSFSAILASACLASACVLTPRASLAQDGGDTQTLLSHLPTTIIDCQKHDAAKEAADAKLLNEAWDKLTKHDIPAVSALQSRLEAAAGHAPDKPSLPEKCGDKLIIYSDNMTDMILASAIIDKIGVKSVEQRAPLPYARIDFIVGWLYYDAGQKDRADDWYARGLLNDPRDVMLASEHANALSQLGRSKDALAFADDFLAKNDDMPDKAKALMLRRRGYALGELGHYDEAITTYEQSLKLEPGNSVAQNEIAWNKAQKAGDVH
jgi:tetratricopeptide (TPR) repeat protein